MVLLWSASAGPARPARRSAAAAAQQEFAAHPRVEGILVGKISVAYHCDRFEYE